VSDRTTARHPLDPLPDVGRTFIAAFESTYQPGTGVDALDVTGHVEHWEQDLEHFLAAGVRHVRYPLRWQRIQPSPGCFDWAETDRVLERLHDRGAVPIVDLVHHTTYPDWLADGFRGADFAPAYLRYAEAVAVRYPWLRAYTLFNEPFATLFLAGHEGLWPPYERGLTGLRRLLLSVLPAIGQAADCWRQLIPEAHHVWVDTAEAHGGSGSGVAHAEVANDRRHVVLDLMLGHDLDLDRPFLRSLVQDEAEALLEMPPRRVDVLGLDYYSHSEWFYDERGGRAPSPHPAGLAAVAKHYSDRYGLPLMLTETNVRGLPSDRISWMRHTLEQYEQALANGVPLHGYCWFPQVDSTDWDSLLARCAGRADPVGVLSLEPDGSRRRTDFTSAWERAAAGLPVADLPATRFQRPCSAELSGFAASMQHWPWQDPSRIQTVPFLRADLPLPSSGPVGRDPLERHMPSTRQLHTDVTTASDLVVLSHLRWPWVWQRPQHVVSRLARHRSRLGARTWFVEEPVTGDVPSPEIRQESLDGLTRVWLVIPAVDGRREDPGFDHPRAGDYGDLLAEVVGVGGSGAPPDVWLYTPMALDLAQRLEPARLVYDVMDDLASFKDAPQGLVLRQRRLLAEADVVFTGGLSLDRSVRRQRQHGVHLFRSGVETAHYRSSRALRRPHERPVAGYVGVVDERLDVHLLHDLAERLPDWTLRIVGPVAKIDPAELPHTANVEYLGLTPYEELPAVMAGLDVALMPFALNAATRSISPTKTLEYLAAGLPVVSTRVPDVVADYTDVVHLADDGGGFAAACREVIQHDARARDRRTRPLQARQEWDVIASSMAELLEQVPGAGSPARDEEPA
jgi:beta-glucosidase/6-phospho-beta-glucosidase/beta-galactosidase/glycosyltransferase involved in cell wall biosynthesis